ncbi:MAG: MerR family transcriptional regulator [Silicimonas sp.]|nr:MerR family transcriptional regulator [Silicimonas sp.]
MKKSRDAFRTISEVAEWLDVPTHVLRFWESRFSQIKPVKRAGGRRYYRPSDMRVIGGVKTLLHDQGMTIRGVQKLFRENGIKHVSSFSAPLFGEEEEVAEETAVFEHEAALAPAAAAARSTRDAEPDPVIDPPEAEVQETPVFLHRSQPKPEPAEEPAAETADPLPEVIEATAEPAGHIPPTPDVPDADPEDDDPRHEAPLGIAARAHLAKRANLESHRGELAAAAARLKDLLERAS